MQKKVVLQFESKRYGRKGSKAFTVLYDDWDPHVTGWIWPAMERYEKALDLSPENITNWDHLAHALPGLINVYSWPGFTSIPISELEVEDVRDLFMDIDDTFHRLWGANSGSLRSARVRAFLSDYLLKLRPDGMLLRVRGSFTPKARSKPLPRALISDQVSIENNAALRAPVGALPHANPAELKVLTKARLQADMQRISDACCSELAAYERACEVIENLRRSPMDGCNEARALKAKLTKGQRIKQAMDLLTPEQRVALIAHYVRLDSAPDASFSKPSYLGSSFLEDELSSLMGIQPDRFLRCVRYRCYPHQSVLIAAIVLIQIHTSWNVSSVMELKASRIQKLGGSQYLIQSLKSKTSDDTPSVFLEGDDNPAVIALRFALTRMQLLKARGWVEKSEEGLWLSPRSNYDSSRGLPVSNLSKGLKNLIARYSLPEFTFEQVRVQTLTIVNLEKGPIAAAEMAGHSNFGSIGGYIDHLVTRRTNSSISLEFEKRWEREIAERITRGPQPRSLMPIGDGASCTDPENPPNESWMQAGVCSSEHCHAGDGCPNRTLVINQSRIVEVLLTNRYYETNWQRLYAGNPQAFAAIHMPRMEFNLYLYKYLQKGPYRSLLDVAV
ncbi:hypothetical protein QTI17_20195 [Variovorax sp. J31P179]|uniref:hypothetical protein n=1 Tax=Variovorax sp. J31P179 TaxID=3053508 RepID=UPI0025759435|nr:hypothetical protein [Variovorax sp. J31P179]MDM0082918.1 hypothetical protein [Variovorax sp. J31P179]